MFVGRVEELECLHAYIADENDKPIYILGSAGMGKSCLLEQFKSDLPEDIIASKIIIEPFSAPMSAIREIYSLLGGNFDSEFGCGFSEVMVLTDGGLLAAPC